MEFHRRVASAPPRAVRGSRSAIPWGGIGIAVVLLVLAIPSPGGSTGAGAHPASPTAAAPTAVRTDALHRVIPRDLAPSEHGWIRPWGTARLSGFHPAVAMGKAPYATPGPLSPLPSRAMARPQAGSTAPVVTSSFAPSSGTTQVLHGPGFQGVDDTQCGCDPPDTEVTAGPGQVVQTVNVYIQVYSTNGTALAGESLATFYGTNSNYFLSDPRIIYDNLSGRYFTSVLEAKTSGSGGVFFAVSNSSDATGNWTIYRMLSTGTSQFPDQPMLGLNDTLLGFGGNVFTYTQSFKGAEYWVVNKTDVLNGRTAAFTSFGPSTTDFSIHPVHTLQASYPLEFVETFGGSPGGLSVFQVHGIPPATTTVNRTNVTIGALGNPPSAPTPSGGDIDAGSAKVDDALASHGRLYVTADDSCTVATVTLGCIRLSVLNETPTSFTIYQDFDIAVPGAYLVYPALALDGRDNVLLAFGVSNTTIYPSIAAATRRSTDAPTTISPMVWVHQGTDGRPSSCSPCRYGDYFGAGTEPGTNRAWVEGEYLTSAQVWQSWNAPIQSAGPTSAAILVPGSADATTAANLTLDLVNATCGPGLSSWCNATIPLGNGAVASLPCAQFGSSIPISAVYNVTGNYTVGSGGLVTVFPDSSCSASTATGTVAIAPATLRVFPSLGATVVASRGSSGDVELPVTFTVHVHGGAAPFSYGWSGLPLGCPGSDLPQVDCFPTSAGTYVVVAAVGDASLVSARGSLHYTVTPPPSASLTSDRTRLDVGMSVRLTGAGANGSGDLSYSWDGLPPGCTPVDPATQDCAPNLPGSWSVTVNVTDAQGVYSVSAPVTIDVNPALNVTLTISPSPSVHEGATVTFAAVPDGGWSPYSYNWTGTPTICGQGGSDGSFRCSPSSGTYRIEVQVRDDLGQTAVANATLVVTSGEGAAPLAPSGTLLTIGGLAVLGAVALGIAVWVVRRRRGAPPSNLPQRNTPATPRRPKA